MHVESSVGLGIQRLRVIDLATGDQPIYNEDRSVVVILNGEIYNFAELRARLIRTGHRFTTQSDTEVIVHLYEEQGLDCMRSLQGMFAFALWDSPRQRLILARDRIGKKPLFYSLHAGRLTFASELRALMTDVTIPREIDPQAMDCFMSYGYVPGPLSIFRAARKLPAATSLVFEDGEARLERYWQLNFSRQHTGVDPRELQEEIRATLRRAVRRRMVADVPLGAFLSGGIDSSAVVAAMAEISSQPVRTFSIGFESQAFNELPFARKIAQQFDTEHKEFVVRADAARIVPEIVRHYGEPFADPSAIPSFYLSKLTRQHVTVALNGDGGDESFGGYSRYVANMLAQRLDRLPGPVRLGAAALGQRMPAGERMGTRQDRVRRLLRSLALDPIQRYSLSMSYFWPSERGLLYTHEFSAVVGQSIAPEIIAAPWHAASGRAPLDVMLETDVESYLPDDLLVKMDIATMAHSLEARSPLLDQELMELAAAIPAGFKVRGGQQKVILRDALRGCLPDEVLDRPKQGFAVPLVDWLRGDLKGWTREILLDPLTASRGYFNQTRVVELIDRHMAGNEDVSLRIWALLMLELWHREILDPPSHVGA